MCFADIHRLPVSKTCTSFIAYQWVAAKGSVESQSERAQQPLCTATVLLLLTITTAVAIASGRSLCHWTKCPIALSTLVSPLKRGLRVPFVLKRFAAEACYISGGNLRLLLD